ncbi:MAG: murein biosynthesis integral membrane protein MurJ [Pirellulales bacterium]
MTSPSALDPAEASPWQLHGRVLANAAMLGVATLLVKLLALAKDWLVARNLGAGDELDAYLIAFLIPSYGAAVLGHSFALAFIPTYIQARRRDAAAVARQLTGAVLAAGTVLLLLVAVALALAAPLLLPLIGSGFGPAKLALAQALLYVMLGVLVLSGLSSIAAAVLNAHERYVATSLAPAAVPVAMIVAFASLGERYGINSLAGGTLAGFALELVLLTAAAWRVDLLPWPRFRNANGALGQIARRYWPVVVSTLLLSSGAMVDQAMAAGLAGGNVSVLNFGGKIVALILSLVAVSLSNVLLPRFSHQLAAGRWGELERTFWTYARAVFIGSLPVVALLVLVSEPLIRLLFERGAFTPETTAAVSRVQVYLALQIPFYVLAMIGARLLAALDANQAVLRIGALNLAINVAGNYLLMQWFGVDGIAMATSFAYLASAVATLVVVRTKLAEARTQVEAPPT